MDTPAYNSPGDDADNDAQLAAQLEHLRQERDKILADAKADFSTRFPQLNSQVRRRLQIAADSRDLQLANIDANFDFEVQQAFNEFERGKRRLQSGVLDVAADRRRRLDVVRAASIAKKKKRGRAAADRLKARSSARSPHTFLASLERQGLVRLVLTPDEVNADLASILRGIDSARFNSTSPALSMDRVQEKTDKILSWKGILHYHDITYEKNDRVSLFANSNGLNRPKAEPLHKYTGTLCSINSKEIYVKTDDGAQHRILVTHLRNGRLSLRPA